MAYPLCQPSEYWTPCRCRVGAWSTASYPTWVACPTSCTAWTCSPAVSTELQRLMSTSLLCDSTCQRRVASAHIGGPKLGCRCSVDDEASSRRCIYMCTTNLAQSHLSQKGPVDKSAGAMSDFFTCFEYASRRGGLRQDTGCDAARARAVPAAHRRQALPSADCGRP